MWMASGGCPALSVVVGDFDLVGVAVLEAEADAPLIVDADAVLAFAVAV